MSVIYLPENPNNFGAGLGAGIGQMLGHWVAGQQKRRDKKKEIEDERVSAMQSALKMPGAQDPQTPVGEFVEGIKTPGSDPRFVKQLLDLKRQGEESKLNKEYTEGKIALNKAEVPLKDAEAAYKAAEAKLLPVRENLLRAQTQAAEFDLKASQAREPIERDKLKAQAEQARAHAKLNQAQANEYEDTKKRAQEFMKNLQGAQEGAPTESGGQPVARKVSDDVGDARAQLLQAGPGGAAGAVPAQAPGVEGGRGNAAGKMTMQQQFEKLSEPEKQFVLAPLLDGDIKAATKNLMEVTKPQYIHNEEEIPGKPGFTQMRRTDLRGGTAVPVGPEIDKRKPPSKETLAAIKGQDQFRAITGGLKELSSQDKLGEFGRAGRQIDDFLTKHGFDAAFGGKNATDFVTMQQHAINSVMQSLAGMGRPNRWLEQMMQNNVAKLTDTKDLRESKFRIFETLMDVAAKDIYEGATTQGMRLPPSFEKMIKDHNLGDEGASMEELQKRINREIVGQGKKKGALNADEIKGKSTEELLKYLKNAD